MPMNPNNPNSQSNRNSNGSGNPASFPKGCLWSLLISIPVWVIVIWAIIHFLI